jgi:TonB family protein
MPQQTRCMTDEPEQNSDSSPVSVPASDRRAHPRQRIRSLAYVHLGESNGGIVLNVSESGVAVQAAEALDADGGSLAMRIEIPRSPKRLEVRGEIVWVGESRKEAGLRFVDLSEDALKRIRSWMAREDSPRTAAEESEEEVEAPAVRAAEVRAETVVTSESLAGREDRAAEADELAVLEEQQSDGIDALADGGDEAVEFGEEFENALVVEAADEPVEAAEDDAEDVVAAMEASPSAPRQPVVAAPAAGKEGRARTIPPPVLTFEQKPQAPISAFTGISGSHGAPAFAVAAAPPAPARYSTADAAATLFPGPRVAAEPAAADDGWKSFRVQLQSGWFLAALVLLLATISFVAGMAVRRGALNAVMGDGDDVVQPKSAPAPPAGNVAASSNGNAAGAAAVGAPAKPLQIEIVDLENHRWTIPAASGANRSDASALRQTPANDVAPPDVGASPAPSASSASNLADRNSGLGAPSAVGLAAPVKPGEPLMLSFPETPIGASGSVAIRATGVVAVPAGDAQSAQHARNLQIGELINLVEPVYPPDARQARLEGTVKLHVVVATTGEVESFHPISGPESLTRAAMIAVREWRYRPTLLNGKAVETQEDVTFVFRLPN